MNYNKFLKYDRINTKKCNDANNKIALIILKELQAQGHDVHLPWAESYALKYLMNYYLQVRTTDLVNDLIALFSKYHINYSTTIVNGIYYLLDKTSRIDIGVDYSFWPGINEINKVNNEFILETKIGTIKVAQASQILRDSEFILSDKLAGHCFARTFEFVRFNPEYKAVIVNTPYIFRDSYYHAYAANGKDVFDLAANAYFNDPESIEKLYKGEVIVEYSYPEIMRETRKLQRIVPNINNTTKLYNLAMYNDMKKNSSRR